MQTMKPRFANTTVAALLLGLAVTGCVETRDDIAFQGLNTIDELDNLEPTLAAHVDPAFFAPWTEVGSLRPLTPQEHRLLESDMGPLFVPDERGRMTIASQFALFTQHLRPRLERWLLRSDDYLAIVREVFSRARLPQELSYLPFIESGYSPRAVSHAGARGLWQFMPATGQRFGLACCQAADERSDPFKSSLAAAAYLRELYLSFQDWSLALAAYNAGEHKIGRLVRMTGARNFFELSRVNDSIPHSYRLRQETLLYVPRFIAMVRILENLDQLGFEQPDWYRSKITLKSTNEPAG